MERKLKIILWITIIILIALVSFAGVYIKDAGIFKNQLPNYLLASEFEGKRMTSFILEEGTEQTIYDKEGKAVREIPEGANEEDYRKEVRDINPAETLTVENYKKVKEIFMARLHDLEIEDYRVRLDENTGKVVVELSDDKKTDQIIQYLLCKGDFSIADAETTEVLLDKSDIKDVKVLYSNANASGVTVYLDIKFNKEGAKKLEEISKKYIKTENTSEGENKSSSEKKVTLSIEGTEMMSTYFGEEITTGELTISLGSGTDQETLQTYVDQGRFYAMLLNHEDMPLSYIVDASEEVTGNISLEEIYLLIGILITIFFLLVVYLIYRYKIDGILAGISMVAWLSILLLVLRYTKTQISLNAIAGIVVLMLVDTYLITKMLNSIKKDTDYENIHKATLRTYLANKEIIIVTIVIGVIFTFMKLIGAYSFGMIIFYGVISIIIANLVFLRSMLLAKYSERK